MLQQVFFRPFVLLAALVGLPSCQSAPPGNTANSEASTIEEGNLPGAIAPKWLDPAESKRLNEAGSPEDVDKLDVFVAMAADAQNDAERQEKVASAAVMIKYALHQLFYAVNLDIRKHPSEDRDFHAALTAFERKAGLAADGVFTMAEFSRLASLAGIEKESPITVVFHIVNVSNDFASAQGTWTLQNEAIANPVNKSEIWCYRPHGTCSVFTAEVAVPSEGGGMTLLTSHEIYDVASWTASEVQAISTTLCRRNTLTLNDETEQAFTLSTDITKEGCPVLGRLAAPRIATLVDGFKPTWEFWRSRRKVLEGVSNSPRPPLGAIDETPSPKK